MATLEEQETIITQSRLDDFVSIYSSNVNDIRFFAKDDRYKLVKEWFDKDSGELEAAEFHIPKDKVNIRKIAKRVSNMSEEQKQVLRDRLHKARNSS